MERRADLAASMIGMAVAFGLAGCAHARPIPSASKPQETVAFAGAPPSAGFTHFSTEMKPLHTVAFYALADRLGDGPSKPWWAARLVEGEIGPAAARWADSRTCQALEAALGEMTRLPVNGLTIGGMRPPGPAPRYVADGEAYTVWSRAGLQSDGSPVAVTVSSNGGDLAVWVEATLARLEPCWTDVPPPAPAR